MKTRNPLFATTFAVIAALALAGEASAKSNPDSRRDVDLVATGADADATGRAKLRIKGADDGRFELRAALLAPGAQFQIVIDGIAVGSFTTDASGAARTRFRSRPRSSKDQLLGFEPRGTTLVVRDASGLDVLAGSIAAGGNSIDDTKIVCCVPDDSGAECEDRTPEQCTAEGGVVSAAASCLPNPCDTVTLPEEDEVICCEPDDSGPECEDRSVAECSAAGGIVIAANTCTGNPCAAVPSTDPDTRCCLPDDSGTECEDRLPAECLAEGGVDIGPGICAVDSCAGVTFPGGGGGGSATVEVRCEKRSSRSKVSVDGRGLVNGNIYTSEIVSGVNEAASGGQAAILGEAEFDYDSDGGDIAAGATAIPASFITGGTVTGRILDSMGNVLAEATAACDVR